MINNIIEDINNIPLTQFHKKYKPNIVNIDGSYEDGIYSIRSNMPDGREGILYLYITDSKYVKHSFKKI